MSSPIVVAVARHGSEAAVRHAADLAVRQGRPLLLVHVAPSDSYGQQLGRDALAIATASADRLSRGGEVRPVLLTGSAVPMLVEAAAGAATVVLGRRLPGARRDPTTSVTVAVSAQVDPPVLSVPTGWVERSHARPVVVGIDPTRLQATPLRWAITHARLAHETLVVVAALGATSPHGSEVVAAARDRIQTLVDELGGDACEVAVEVVRADPSEALLGAAERADLVVLGRHTPVVPSGSRLAPTARTVLESAACPVLLTPPDGTGAPNGARTHQDCARA